MLIVGLQTNVFTIGSSSCVRDEDLRFQPAKLIDEPGHGSRHLYVTMVHGATASAPLPFFHKT